MRETNVTIVSTNISKKILDNYKDYYVVDSNFKKEDLLLKNKIIFFNVLNNLNEDKVKSLYNFLKENKIKFINVTNDMELVLCTDYLIIYDKDKIIIEGNTLEVLKQEKLLKRVGLNLPFIVELSLLLKDYSLISEIYLDKESLVNKLWN